MWRSIANHLRRIAGLRRPASTACERHLIDAVDHADFEWRQHACERAEQHDSRPWWSHSPAGH